MYSELFINQMPSRYSHGHQACDSVSHLMHTFISKIDGLCLHSTSILSAHYAAICGPKLHTICSAFASVSHLPSVHHAIHHSVCTCRQIAAQTNTMILAGYETTANTLAYSIYLLGKNPEAQQQLLQEIDQSQGRPGYDSLHQFPYAAAVINEALRLYPPATVLSRVATEDVQASQPVPSSGFLAAVLGCQKTACKSVLPDQFTLLPFGTGMISQTYCRSN